MPGIRCPECNKFARLEAGEPDVENIDIEIDGQITCDVRVVALCADCSEELKEGTLELEDEIDEEILEEHSGDGHELKVLSESVTKTGGKGTFGATVTYAVRCSCQSENDQALERGDLDDILTLDDMDEV